MALCCRGVPAESPRRRRRHLRRRRPGRPRRSRAARPRVSSAPTRATSAWCSTRASSRSTTATRHSVHPAVLPLLPARFATTLCCYHCCCLVAIVCTTLRCCLDESFANCLTESFEPAACEAICAKAAGCACLEYTPDPQAGGGRHRCKIYTGVTALKTFARHDAYVLSSNDGHTAEAFEPAEYTDDETEVTCHDTAQPSGRHSSRSPATLTWPLRAGAEPGARSQ